MRDGGGDVPVAEGTAVRCQHRDGMTVTALRIPHANLPTLAYCVQTRDVSVVFSSDQNGTDPKFIDFARGGQPIGIEITTPAKFSLDGLNRVLRDLGFAAATRDELAPVMAA